MSIAYESAKALTVELGVAAAYDAVYPQWAGKLQNLPQDYRDGMGRYLVFGISPGSFLRGVLSNDLFVAVGKLEPEDMPLLHTICSFLYNYAPSTSFGSVQKYNDWVMQSGAFPKTPEAADE